jgi:AraC-like DNA-binding protein
MGLRVIPFSELYKMDYSILRIVPFYHRWEDGDSFTTPENGRVNSGLMYFVDCATDYIIDGQLVFGAQHGALSYVPQGAQYTCRFHHCHLDKYRSNEHLINFELFDAEGNPFVLSDSVQIIQPRDSAWYARRFDEVLHLFHHSGAPNGQIKALVYSILTDLSLEQRKERLAVGRFSQIYLGVLHVEKHYTDPIQISDIAEMCHISEAHFRKRFREYTGMSPNQYITWLRISKARLLLESGSVSVSQAAEAVGYADPSYFSRLFKKKTGILPKDVIKT